MTLLIKERSQWHLLVINAFKLPQQSYSECDCHTLLKKIILIWIFLIGNHFPLVLNGGIGEQQKRKEKNRDYLNYINTKLQTWNVSWIIKMNNSNADAIYHNMCAVNAYSALLKAFMIVCIIDCTKIKVGILQPKQSCLRWVWGSESCVNPAVFMHKVQWPSQHQYC